MPRFCEVCGSSLSANAGFCSGCGNKTGTPAPVPSGSGGTAAQPARVREEKIMLDDYGVTVSNARFIVDGQTYAMNGITSVKSTVTHPSKFWPIITILFGAFGILTYLSLGFLFGVLVAVGIIIVGVLWFNSKKPTYAVRLTSASGETEAYLSRDGELVGRIVNAIN